jgi:hypothetical protein
MVIHMKDPAIRATAVAIALTSNVLVTTLIILGALALLLLAGIALPAVWSARPSRRQAAAEVLDQILINLRR